MNRDPSFVVSESLHLAAYGNTSVGRSQYPSSHSLHHLDGQALRDWRSKFLKPSRIVVSAVGLPHTDVEQLTEHVFSYLDTDESKVPTPEKEKAVYTVI